MADAARLMKKYGFSQIPIVANNKVVGKISERDILQALYSKIAGANTSLSAVMDTNVCTVQESESIDLLPELLSQHLMVVAVRKAKPIAVITRSDLIDFLSHK